jgi:hypothetical protein
MPRATRSKTSSKGGNDLPPNSSSVDVTNQVAASSAVPLKGRRRATKVVAPAEAPTPAPAPVDAGNVLANEAQGQQHTVAPAKKIAKKGNRKGKLQITPLTASQEAKLKVFLKFLYMFMFSDSFLGPRLQE